MKKLLLVLAIVLMAVPAFAGSWNVTLIYTKSPGPNLNHEVIEYPSGTQRCDIAAAAPASCSFSLPVDGPFGQTPVVKSYDAVGTSGAVATFIGPPLTAQIAPASGMSATIIWVP